MPEITDDEIPFDIPENWKWVYMGEIFVHNTGKALNNADKEGVLLEYITTSNLYWDRFELDELRSMFFKESEIEKCTIHKGDLLICEGGDIGRSAIWGFDYEMRIQNHIHKLRGYGDINHKFYYYIMRNYKDSGMIDGRGIGLQGFSSKRVHTLVVPLPPISEQTRIVDKLDAVLAEIDIIDDLQEKYRNDLATLKSKIIDAGIRGKLTEQLPEDGDAETLYAQIQEEKTKLIKEGKIKKEKLLPDISADEIPFEIPKNWKWVRLGTVINEVIVPQRDKPKVFDGDIPWCRIEDADGDYMSRSHSDQNVSIETVEKMNLRVFPAGTVLSACSGGSIGRILITTTELCTNQTFNGLVCSKGLFNRYLFHFLRNSIGNLKRMGSGAAMEYVSQKKITEMLLPLPPIVEQRRIVENIENLLEICR